jgi:APA family basic amino acid/polyamine antiporter
LILSVSSSKTSLAIESGKELTKQPTGEFARRLGLFDATMIVMGGIIGSGIFMNPHVVALYVHTPFLILGAWFFGGVIALAGAFIYAELAAQVPQVGGQYAYFRSAYHPLIAFLFGWALLLVSNTGGMAAVAMTFARYFIELTGTPMSESAIAVIVLIALTFVNCLGVRTGSTFQNILMVLKIAAIATLVGIGYFFISPSSAHHQLTSDQPMSFDLLTMFGAAMVPVLFSYGGWQTANFIAGEIREPQKNLPRGLILGVIGVVTLYLAVNLVSVRALGAGGLALTTTPASEVMSMALGKTGSTIIAIGITISTLGFLSQSILTAPRVYFAMADDGLFFKRIAWLHPKTRVPVFAIILQGVLASVIALSGTYEQILNYVVSDDFIFFGLAASCIFIFRKRTIGDERDQNKFAMPGHPYSTILFIIVCCLVVINTTYKFPANTLIGIGIIFTGIPVYYFWKRRKLS